MSNTACALPPDDSLRIFRSVPGLYLVLLPDFTIVEASDAYLKATMTQREAIVGQWVFHIFPDNPEEAEATGEDNLRASLMRVLNLRAGDTMAVQKYDVRRPGSEGGGFETRYWSVCNAPVLDPQSGAVNYIVNSVTDVTEFIRAKQTSTEQERRVEELHSRAGQMEAEVFRRAQEIHEVNRLLREKNDELAALYDKAAEMDRLKTHFFANVSHELRTPLTLILGPVRRMLSSGALNAEDTRGLEVVERNAGMLLKQVNDLLDISKLDAGSMDVHYAEFDLGRLCRLAASHFETLAEDSGIRFVIHVPEAEIPAQADPEKLERVLLNLLSNAFKVTPLKGSIGVSLRVNGAEATMGVADSGPGIPPDMRTVIFERFRQLDTAHSFRGTGLGLSIVKEFVGLHGGHVTVGASEEGGALFEVTIPLVAPAGASVESAKPEASWDIPASTYTDTANARERSVADVAPADAPLVLVVEDNPEMSDFICGALSRHYRVVSAPNGRDGLEKALALHPALIVSDVMMPYMNGDDMVLALRAHEGMQSVPVILLTARADDELRARLLRSAVQDYVSKPFQTEILLARIGSLIDERERHRLQIQQAYGLLRASTDWIADTIFVKDRSGRYLMVNPAGAAFVNSTVDDVVGKEDSDFLPAETARQIRADDIAVMQGGVTVSYEQEVILPAETRTVITTKGPFRDQSGHVVGLIGISRDITAQKVAERSLAASEARERGFLKDILRGVTEGKLLLCDTAEELPDRGEALNSLLTLAADGLSGVRRAVNAAADTIGLSMERTIDLVTAVSEAAMNAVVHAGGGTAEVTSGPNGSLRVWVTDEGQGIDISRIPNATLEKGYTTAGTLGHGFFLILSSVDCVYLLTGASGTTLVMEQNPVPPEPFWMRR